MMPVRLINTSIRYLDTGGQEIHLKSPSIHHRNETVSGFGDPMLLGARAFTVGAWRLTARAGLTVPLGRTEENPFALGDMGLEHQHIQLGTGTFNPVVAAEAARSWGSWRFGLFALSQQVVYENSKGYLAGDRYAVGVALLRRLGSRWSARGSVDALGETAERWNGIKHTDDGNQGRIDLIFGLGASFAVTPTFGVDVALKIPAVTHAVGGQLSMPALLEVGASWSFGSPQARPEEEHDHDHGHDHDEGADEHTAALHPDTTGLDVSDLGKPGEAVDLVPVVGKVTVFDFWAEWCKPCKVLEPALVEIARVHPEIVAIRRIDVVDWDSAAVARHLTPKGFNLPHLKVFDTSGKLVIERSSETGQLENMISSVRNLVESEAAKRARTSPATTPLPLAPAQGNAPEPPSPPGQPARVQPAAIVQIAVTTNGFEPANVTVPAGELVTLRFLRKVEQTCATEIVMEVDGKKIVKDLPLNQLVDLTVTFAKPGIVRYSCAMDMIRGSVTVQ